MSAPLDISAFDSAAFDRAANPVLRLISQDEAKKLVDYQGDPSLRGRIDELAAKCNEGELTVAERAEYEGYVQANKFVAILQAQARKRLGPG